MLRKVICNILFGVFFVGTLCAGTENIKAELVSMEEAEMYFEDGTTTGKLTDDNFNTYIDVSGKTLVIENTENVAGIYFKWDQPVGDYYIFTDDTEGITCDVNVERIDATQIIHQYVDMHFGGSTIKVEMPENAKLCDIYFMDFGTLPEWVQVWSEPYESADMLFIPTHADDELLFFGGAMPYYAGELGMKVQVAYMTHHWEQRYRPHELLDGLWTCGVTAYPIIGPFADYYSESLEHAKTLYPEEDVIGYMVELIRRFKPYVILGHDINGEYGHGVHMYNTDALMKALEISNDGAQYPESATEYGLWDVPKTYLHLYKENQIVMKWEEPLSRFGGLDGVEVAALAFECHPSQNMYYSVKRAPGSVYGCTEFGLYRTTVGPDVAKNDFLENIEFTKETENK